MLSEHKIKAVNALLTQALALHNHDRLTLKLAERDLERQAHEIEALQVKPTRHTAKPKHEPIKLCIKREYRSETAAIHAARSLGKTVRAYLCPECGKHHITSQVKSR
jgi:hypothetical protein